MWSFLYQFLVPAACVAVSEDSTEKMENRIAQTDNSDFKYHLLITANPLSDNKAALSIFKMIKRLDILSGDINIFFPGFHTSESNQADSQDDIEANIANIKKNNEKDFADYHGKEAVYHLYTESEGDIYFNDADFSNFMLDLEDRSRYFEYLGRTELVVLPSFNGKIEYNYLRTFNLETLSEQNNSKLEEFLISVLKLIRKDPDNTNYKLLDKIAEKYDETTADSKRTFSSEVIIKLDSEILKYMKWKEADEIFFISYSSKDEFHAYALKGLLEKKGKKVWMAPEGIPSGFDYAQAIPAALRLTSRFIVLLSDNSARSEWVRREIGKAISNKIRIDGICIDEFSFEKLKKYDHLDFMFENVQLKYKIGDLFEDVNLLNNLIS